jgi:hypothetical protein
MQHITIVQNVKNYLPSEAVSMPEDLQLEQLLLRGNANVSRMPLELRCVSRGTILLKIRDWQMRTW